MEEHVRQINRLMEKGYEDSMRGRSVEAAQTWLECWELVKTHLPTRPFDLAEERQAFAGLDEVLFNWLPEVEGELGNASLEDAAFAEKHVRFCDEALELITMPDHRANFLRSRAQGLWRMGRREEAEAGLQALLAEDADDAWTYAAWGDLYALEEPVDLARAEVIYREARERATLREPEVLDERFMMLAEMRGEKPEPPADEDPHEHGEHCGCGAPRTPVVQAVSTRIGRNEPCPCGSGKKYKKCCGAN